MSKQFGGDRSEQIELDWDLLPHIDTEAKLSLLCRFVLQAENLSLAYALHLPNKKIAFGQGEKHKQQCLAALATFDQ
jgi:hypothetical protein